jgi:non-specific serine/threonine protein kinase
MRGVGPEADRLESWKEIAAYLNRGVRTVRRWEAEEGLPVHRHMHRTLASVYAFKSEIDAWRRSTPRNDLEPASIKSVAILPFVDLGATAETGYFADGLTDEVIADLSRVRSLRVVSRTSSMRFKGTRSDVRRIARELAVQYVVEGTVRRSGSRLRVTAQLIDAHADAHIWGDKYDGMLEDVFGIQERLARLIVSALEVRLTAEEDRTLSERPFASVPAYECYLQARQESYRWRKDAIDRAVQLLRNGLSLIGDNPVLHAALGRAHLQYREAGIDFSDDPLREADANVRKVLAVDPRSSAGLQLRGWIRYSSGQTQEAVRDLKRALDADPNNADTLALLSNCYLISGKPDAGRPLIDRLLAVDPLTPLTRCMPGFADVAEGRFASALEPYRLMLDLDPGNPMARLFYVVLLMLNRHGTEAIAVVRACPRDIRDTAPARIAAFLAYAVAGDRVRARARLTPEIDSIAGKTTDVFPRLLAEGYALIGETQRALDWLEIATARGFINYPFLASYDPSLESLRTDPRFLQLMETVRDRWQNFEV